VGEWPRRAPFVLLILFRKRLVIGVFISPEIRSRFDYEKFPWELFLEVASDFKAEKLENFRII